MACLVLLGVLYGVKLALLQVAIPLEASLDLGDLTEDGDDSDVHKGNLTFLESGQRALKRGQDSEARGFFELCIDEEEKKLVAAESLPTQKKRQAAADEVTRRLNVCRAALGELRLVGAGKPQNMSAAKILLQQAADAGEADALYALGVIYGSTPVTTTEESQRAEALAVLHMYAASTSGHPGGLMAMGYRHIHGYGVPKSCSAAALNYIDVGKRVADVHSSGIPKAVELIRLNLHAKDRKALSSSEMNLFSQIATSGDTTVAAAIGKRHLLGTEGFRQDYKKARHYLRMAANQNHAGALALLGYMHCLGLGIPKNLDTAYSYFVSAAAQNDSMGHNGLGYIYFRGTNSQSRNVRLAFKHFNESAFGGSSDGMFNLASMFLTGTGTQQSFQHAVLYYTQAIDRGHTPAAYSLAVMHLNGIGVMRDCTIAVNLLKMVCERGEWVSSKLSEAHENGDRNPDKAAWLFLKLAEAGHEVAQMNAAHLYDMGSASVLLPDEPSWASEHELSAGGGTTLGVSSETRMQGRALAQRFYELSAEQGSASSELRLGDYAYYGWGMTAYFNETEPEGPMAYSDDLLEFAEDSPLELRPQRLDYAVSLMRYRKAAEMTVTGEWMQGFVARGFFNLGFMHQFGFGVPQDLNVAKKHYHRCREVDPSGLHTPVTMVLVLLGVHMFLLRLSPWEVITDRFMTDMRTHILVLHLAAIIALLIARRKFAAGSSRGGGRRSRSHGGEEDGRSPAQRTAVEENPQAAWAAAAVGAVVGQPSAMPAAVPAAAMDVAAQTPAQPTSAPAVASAAAAQEAEQDVPPPQPGVFEL
eukprot:TRINITY_DN43957_c0_g1_i1.p1 TRINITY_DN43957_c0_g1~~TRINITY_DN43957_c0_g1_i1.p1  ORF type:complete len:846 (+),score=143.41 TRINITY_DN43957_c0_g1_i1:101-2539(+)